MALEVWLAYLLTCILISLVPGAGAVASMSSGLSHGFRRGYWNVIGLQLALAAQVLVVALGLGALLTASELAFTLIKWLGVGYLLYLGWKQWRAPVGAQPTVATAGNALAHPLQLVLRGFLVNASNPKAIVFMLAVLPQFIEPARPLPAQYLILTLTMVSVDLLVMAGYTGLAARVLRRLRDPRQQRLLNRTFGGLFAATAAILASVRQVAR